MEVFFYTHAQPQDAGRILQNVFMRPISTQPTCMACLSPAMSCVSRTPALIRTFPRPECFSPSAFTASCNVRHMSNT